MEKRINPHFQIAQIMFSMHLLSENVSLRTLFQTIDRVFLQAFVGVHMELVIKLLNLKTHISELEKTKMEFITQMDRLRMVHPACENELIAKKERSLFHVMDFENKLKKTESNLKVAALYESGNVKTSEINKLRTTDVATCDREQEITVKLKSLKSKHIVWLKS